MKSMGILLIAIGHILSGCSTYFYKVSGKNVTIYLRDSDIKKPMFACSLDGYKTRKIKQEKGVWVVTLPANTSFSYFYMVDGKPFLPSCPMKEYDDFGSENCIFEPEL